MQDPVRILPPPCPWTESGTYHPHVLGLLEHSRQGAVRDWVRSARLDPGASAGGERGGGKARVRTGGGGKGEGGWGGRWVEGVASKWMDAAMHDLGTHAADRPGRGVCVWEGGDEGCYTGNAAPVLCAWHWQRITWPPGHPASNKGQPPGKPKLPPKPVSGVVSMCPGFRTATPRGLATWGFGGAGLYNNTTRVRLHDSICTQHKKFSKTVPRTHICPHHIIIIIIKRRSFRNKSHTSHGQRPWPKRKKSITH